MVSLESSARARRVAPVAPLMAALLASLIGAGALAQSGPLEEVIVTAAKRQQTLQEIPVAVSVVAAEDMQRAQVLDIKDLQTLVPSLRVTQLQNSAQTNFVIRGFGNGANNAGVEPSVGVFVDGVYRSRVGSALADLPKVQRIEVLRGPQSTLFGKNASAGVISVITARPDLSAYSGSLGATLGNYNQTIVRGDVTGPLGDNLAFSLFGSMNNRDGYFDNLGVGGESNELDRWNFRGQLLWEASARAEFRLIVDAENIDEVCCGVASLLDGPTGAVIRALGGNLLAAQPFAYANFLDFAPGNEIETQGTSLHFDYDFDNFTLTSITAFRTLDQFQFGDVDYTSARLVEPEGGNLSRTRIDTFTQELRLTSATDGPLQWMLGAFYFDEDVKLDGALTWGADFRAYADGLSGGGISALEGILGLPRGTFFQTGTGFPAESFTLDDKTLSLFAQADYAFTDALTLTLGLNYTESKKEAGSNVVSTGRFSALPLAGPFAALRPLQITPPFLNFPNAVEGNRTDDDDLTYTLRLAWDVTPIVNVYAAVSTGFKASSWNLSRDSRPLAADLRALRAAGLSLPNLRSGTRFAGPEESAVYEVGLKAGWEMIAVNLALFTQQIEGFQSNVFSGTGFNLANAGKLSTDGAELELNWAPLEGLRIGFASTYLDPLYDDFKGAIGPGNVPTDLSGNRPAGIPRFSTNANIAYSFDLLRNAQGYVRFEHIYEYQTLVAENVPRFVALRDVNTVNASAGVTFGSGFQVNFWGRNLNADEYLLSAFPSVAQAGSFSGYPNQPRTYGVTLTYNFD